MERMVVSYMYVVIAIHLLAAKASHPSDLARRKDRSQRMADHPRERVIDMEGGKKNEPSLGGWVANRKWQRMDGDLRCSRWQKEFSALGWDDVDQ